jgi:preprotein translocase subunit SecA
LDLLPEDPVWAAHEDDLRRHFTVEYSLSNSISMGVSKEIIIEEVTALALAAYGELEERIGAELRDIERQILLYTIDHLWKAHLYEMDHLKEAIRYRGYGQRDPLSEYKQEGFTLFGQMMERLAFEIAGRVLHIRPEERPRIQQAPRVRYQEVHGEEPGASAQPQAPQPRPEATPLLPGTRSVQAPPPSAQRAQQAAAFASASIGRNDPCPCGSGKKFKKCHGQGL